MLCIKRHSPRLLHLHEVTVSSTCGKILRDVGNGSLHDDVIKWKHLPCYWPFVWGIHQSPVNSPHKGQWRGAFMFSLICAWINRLVNSREAGYLRRYCAHYDVIVMIEPQQYRPVHVYCGIIIYSRFFSLPCRDGECYIESHNIEIFHFDRTMKPCNRHHEENLPLKIRVGFWPDKSPPKHS